MTSAAPTPARREWNHSYNWIIALAGMGGAIALIFFYQVHWLPDLFADLLAQGMPGTDAPRVYALTTLFFALPGVVLVGAALLWHFRTSLLSRILVLLVACAWFILVSPCGLGRGGTSTSGMGEQIMLRAGADSAIASAWGDAIVGGSMIGVLLGMAVGAFVLSRTLSQSRRKRMPRPR